MPNIKANGIDIEYDTFGDSSNPAILMIMGLSGQMILWDKVLCEGIADQGLYVIRFDNRDVGLSSKIEGSPAEDPAKLLAAVWKGEKITPPYTLEDMADDGFGLMDGLGIKKAHICGASMGGMIAQTMAIMHPDRVLSLISIASATGNPDSIDHEMPPNEQPFVPPEPAPTERFAYIEHNVNGMRELSGPGFEFNEEESRILVTQLYDRCFYPQGSARQVLAIIASGNRKPALLKLNVPTLVIHGDCDPLVPVKGGIDTANAIPGAELMIIKGMGHDIPKQIWPDIIRAISRHTRKSAVLYK